ncbi:heterogeneous nuclear ribonucleoprotein U-like protein 1 isoform X2 [Punica granatum]|uniref:Heterogeneous nuclear ribonucleoprotein U-like protein 1 isoform X2 n=1 Tax=Punica granatum TaxID=22663 RepID=A0A6P8DHH5_PUNGR|nr:heterogeneous nuclear ribonucleoprotein U-like protein 1 isoform X2 [Punica granatum]
MASLKREIPGDAEAEQEPKKTRTAGDVPAPAAKLRVELNPADCNLDFNIDGNGLGGSGFHDGGFAYCWSGARATTGISGGKYCFGCKIVSIQPVDMPDTPPKDQHLCRIGVSRGEEPVGNLGETQHSFGFGATGKFSNAGKFLDYGEKFGVGDTIVCAVDLESEPRTCIGFSKNGKWLGASTEFYGCLSGLMMSKPSLRKHQWELALFPHVLLKNVVVELQFSLEDGLVPEGGFKPWASAIEDGNAVIGPVFSSVSDCEVIMMVGLPASGKTTWAEKWIQDHPEKRYVLLGTNLILDQMKVPGLYRKQNYGERFDRLMDKATAIYNTLLPLAAKTPRNFIIDQTNVYKSARTRKLKPFSSFQKIAVVIFPRPEELKLRSQKRFQEMGKEVPDDALNSMIANFVLPMSKDMPGSDEYFDQVIFTELNREESLRYLNEMKEAVACRPNSNMKNNFLSPPSWEKSAASYTSLHDGRASSVITGPHINSYALPDPLYHNHQAPQGHQQSPFPGAPRGSFPSSVSSDNIGHMRTAIPTPRASLEHHQSYQFESNYYNQPNMASFYTSHNVPSGPYRVGANQPPVGLSWTSPATYNPVGHDYGVYRNPTSAPPVVHDPAHAQRPLYRSAPAVPPPPRARGYARPAYSYPRYN